MAKYIVIEDFESQWVQPNTQEKKVAIFTKDTIIQALPSPVDGKLKTRVDGTLPTFKSGEILVDIIENKVNLIKEQITKIDKNQNAMKWLYLGGTVALLWWFIYGRKKKVATVN